VRTAQSICWCFVRFLGTSMWSPLIHHQVAALKVLASWNLPVDFVGWCCRECLVWVHAVPSPRFALVLGSTSSWCPRKVHTLVWADLQGKPGRCCLQEPRDTSTSEEQTIRSALTGSLRVHPLQAISHARLRRTLHKERFSGCPAAQSLQH